LPVVPAPIAAMCMSAAPATTFTVVGRPSSAAEAAVSVPTTDAAGISSGSFDRSSFVSLSSASS
jgi:hypothetical protein